jgi:outer membrane protein TolC
MHVKFEINPLKHWVMLLIGITVSAAPNFVLAQVSLSTVVDLAQRNSSEVRLAQAGVDKANAALAQSEDVFIPSLVVGSTLGYSIGFPTGQPSIANASIQSLVFSLPQRQYIRAAQAGVTAATLSLHEAREQVALDASTAYIELDSVGRELEAARQQEEFASKLVTIEQERAEAGVDSLSDLLQARLTAAQLKLKRLHLDSRTMMLSKQLAVLTGLPVGSITPDHSSIPEIPAVKADDAPRTTSGIASAGMLARSKQLQAQGDQKAGKWPQVGFGAQYNLDSDALNDYSTYFKNFTPNNFAFGFSFQIPVFDRSHRAKARESAADALRATVEAEQAQHQGEIQIASLTGSLRELDTLTEIASLKQQIAHEQLQTVLAQLELGDGAQPGAQSQLSPKTEQLARIDERQKFQDALDAELDLSKTRLSLLRALGHMEDWLAELHAKK